jgi:two-component system nitrogen regulation sensor histidine kinase NtrY
MKTNLTENAKSFVQLSEHRRRKREIILIVVIFVTIALLTFVENRIVHFGADIPISNTILMFILININLLLLILLIFLVFGNVVKLLYDRKRKVLGAKLRTRLVVAFITLTLLPTIILFFFSINFITNSIEFWFNVPVEQSLLNSLQVGRSLYRHIEENNRFFIERIAYQVKAKKMLSVQNRNALSRYIQIAQRAFNLDAIEVYSSNSQRLTFAISSNLEAEGLATISVNDLQKDFGPEKTRTVSETLNTGELIRTIGTVPFGQPHREADGFVIVTIFIPPNLSENMDSISRGFEEYQQIKLLKEPIQITYYITLSIVALLFSSVQFGSDFILPDPSAFRSRNWRKRPYGLPKGT